MKIEEMTNEGLLDWTMNRAAGVGQHCESDIPLSNQGRAELLRRLNAGEPGKPRCPKCQSKNTQGVGGFECSDCGTEFITHEFFPAERQEGWADFVKVLIEVGSLCSPTEVNKHNCVTCQIVYERVPWLAEFLRPLPAPPSAPETQKEK